MPAGRFSSRTARRRAPALQATFSPNLYLCEIGALLHRCGQNPKPEASAARPRALPAPPNSKQSLPRAGQDREIPPLFWAELAQLVRAAVS